MEIPVAMGKLIDLLLLRGFRNMGQTPGVQAFEIDAEWKGRINPHDETTDGVPPFAAMLECNGLPAICIDPAGGAALGNTEDRLIAALDAAIERESEPANA